MAATLPKPTPEIVRAACEMFEQDELLVEGALQQLLTAFPNNKGREHVLLKVVVLNRLYATNIFAVTPLALQIAELNVDERLAAGDPGLVDEIARFTPGGKIRSIFSFATKYCSWHNPTAYPIYDSFVDSSLWAYQKQDHFSEFARNDLRTFGTFLKVLNDFRSHYGLTAFTHKEIDKFLWSKGKEIGAARRPAAAAAA